MNTPQALQPQLPERADLQQLKRRARELLRAWQAGEADSLARAAPYFQHPKTGQTPATLAALLGESAALELLAARGTQPELPAVRERFLAACAAADAATARALLEEQPGL
ncbi:hypothetical protein [Paucibacter sp. B51]|uniref:hypothetical protein n=1 Tax=Paucibacter sp. B51 TaxID=2993315 RepID=UPI0022EBCB83|nr:hypothetical protein [Paucibacter sp. B51]